ncbi:Gfo/Idh/MocA family oxidoreductase [Enterococcus sp. 669A]|uniref:Gfo/Idh/MocA family oxidoreductase n=1 Tax=Candidatus Enterococcus moelleringii TaxID=2815325 RepID=A0ABS3L541_9ENTE|nr:Gfo/Idh/MocA family oxidoreductase [Enterococcus sp. 669A]MBO1304734.1 Gfo/Idh/MocA family oxidoreductase [Enterococcus sp. 669A]
MKIGIIGCAHMQANSYTEEFIKEKVEIIGIYDHNLLRGSQFAKKYDLPFFKSLEKILCTDIDSVLICSENSLHFDYTLAASLHKKHVIVEKPLALTTRDALNMIVACREAKVKLLVAHPIRFSKTILDLQDEYSQGNLGNIIAMNCTNRGKNPGGWFLDKELSGGGAILDHMVHLIDLSRWLFQFEIASIVARAQRRANNEIEDAGLINIVFTNGAILSLDTSWNRPLNYPVWGDVTLEIISEKGFTFVDAIGRKVDFYTRDDNYSYLNFEPSMDSVMIQSFIECINQDQSEPVNGLDGLYTVQIATLAYLSLKMDRVIYRHEFEELLDQPLVSKHTP